MKKIFVLGSLNMDIVISSPYMPINGETIMGTNYMTNPGGKGANQAVACGKMNNKVYFSGCIGDDSFGQELQDNLDKYGVDTTCIRKVKNTSTGTAIIIIVDHDNRIILAPNANMLVNEHDVDNLLRKANVGDIFMSQLEVPIQVVGYGLQKAKEKGMVTILNPAPLNTQINDYLKYVDILILNETEIRLLTEMGLEKSQKKHLLCHKIYDIYHIPIIVVTLGANGHALFQNKNYVESPCMKVEAVDTTAAGDTFCGVFASMLASETPLEEALRIASIAASLAVTKVGAQISIPNYDEVKKYFKIYK